MNTNDFKELIKILEKYVKILELMKEFRKKVKV